MSERVGKQQSAGAALGEAFGLKGEGQVRMVECRGCGVELECYPDTWELAKTLSRILHARGERGLKSGEILCCKSCRRLEELKMSEADAKREDRSRRLLARIRNEQPIAPDERRWLLDNFPKALTAAQSSAGRHSGRRRPGA